MSWNKVKFWNGNEGQKNKTSIVKETQKDLNSRHEFLERPTNTETINQYLPCMLLFICHWWNSVWSRFLVLLKYMTLWPTSCKRSPVSLPSCGLEWYACNLSHLQSFFRPCPFYGNWRSRDEAGYVWSSPSFQNTSYDDKDYWHQWHRFKREKKYSLARQLRI